MRKEYLILFAIFVFVLTLFFFFSKQKIHTSPENIPAVTLTIQPVINAGPFYPIAQFKERITKKPFGIYITPQNSPVSPERFQGYHTGVDVEYEDITGDVPVFTVCGGEIVLAKWVSGYGGTIVLKCSINNQDYYLVYGHLRVSSIIKNIKVLKGDQIAVLGTGKTEETDFERKHLHFAIHKDALDLRGYVQNQSDLKNWLDPLSNSQILK
jgi:murein DD-endopeptidase MepM/ murein hydrolase activator NlpD